MAIQQLDLFAAFQAPPQVEEKKPEVPPVVETTFEPVVLLEDRETITDEPVVEKTIESIVIEEEPVVEVVKQPQENRVVEPSIVFQDENISVKIKPKVVVQQTVVTKTREVAVKPKSKRGRKSYKEHSCIYETCF